MPCETPPYSSLITYLVGALTTIAAVWVAHVCAIRRESDSREHAAETARENRKQDFIGLMSGMRAEAERFTGDYFAGRIFPTRIYEIRRESPKIMRDLDTNRKVAFDNAITALCQLTDSQVSDTAGGNSPEGRRRVTEAIDKVIASLS